MIVRDADYETDALAIMEGARDFVSRMGWADFIPDDLTAAVGPVLGLPGMKVTVAEHEGRIAGAIGMIHAPFLWNRELTSADELFWWAAPDAPKTTALRLIRPVIRSADVVIFRSLPSSPDGVERVYQKLGLIRTETVWMRRWR